MLRIPANFTEKIRCIFRQITRRMVWAAQAGGRKRFSVQAATASFSSEMAVGGGRARECLGTGPRRMESACGKQGGEK